MYHIAYIYIYTYIFHAYIVMHIDAGFNNGTSLWPIFEVGEFRGRSHHLGGHPGAPWEQIGRVSFVHDLYIILCYIMLYYIKLCYIKLCYIILNYVILYYIMLYYTMLYYTILYYVILYYVILYYIMLYYIILCYIILYYILYVYTSLQFYQIGRRMDG